MYIYRHRTVANQILLHAEMHLAMVAIIIKHDNCHSSNRNSISIYK